MPSNTMSVSLLKNGYFLTNNSKVYHVSDLMGWYIKESGVCDLPDELRALEFTPNSKQSIE